jgi:hypothetical protein
LTSPKAEVNLSKSFTNLASSYSHSTVHGACLYLPHLVNEFSLSWQNIAKLGADSGRSDCLEDFATFPRRCRAIPNSACRKQHLTKLLQIASAFPRRIWCFRLEPPRFSVSFRDERRLPVASMALRLAHFHRKPLGTDHVRHRLTLAEKHRQHRHMSTDRRCVAQQPYGCTGQFKKPFTFLQLGRLGP